jgi:hypothetical protein
MPLAMAVPDSTPIRKPEFILSVSLKPRQFSNSSIIEKNHHQVAEVAKCRTSKKKQRFGLY